ncbi:hypothetical protein A1D29_04790 [Pasteurellaceae bacterium Orientalotternb1]|nr:hypothetical protein A1D29_04790 [Pasteurellaceae bacterium Orientalotternb1]
MKLVKFVPAIAATFVLAACSTTNDMPQPAKEMPMATTETVGNGVQVSNQAVMTKTKSVAYKCNSGQVVVAYAFQDNDAKSANVRLGKGKPEIHGFLISPEWSQKVDSPVFTSGDYVLTSDKGLTFDTATKTDLVMVTKGDQILAKNCKINKTATKLLNK